MNPVSLTDQKTIERLTRGREVLLADTEKGGLMDLLRRKLGTITRNVYIVGHIPEQGEDYYDVLVDGTTVVHLEIPHKGVEGEVVFESMTFQEYRKRRGRLSRMQARKLEIALQLASAHRLG